MSWLCALLCLFCGQALAQERVLVFAAASLKNALDEVNSAYGRPVSASYAASSALARQIEAGAPAQVFISADEEWMDYLEKKPTVHVLKRRDLLSNRLVWIVPSNARTTSEPLAALGDRGRLGLGDQQHVPAGKDARAAREKHGQWWRL
jgi:molybdate transport system substrate-binding protein